jgi:hypothetical protein
MAQTIKEIKPKERISLGGRFLVTAEVTLGTEYKTGGFVLTEANLKECGLPDAIVNSGWVNPLSKAEASGFYELLIEGAPTEVQTVKIAAYVLGTATAGKPFKEPASANGELSEYKLVVALIGQ